MIRIRFSLLTSILYSFEIHCSSEKSLFPACPKRVSFDVPTLVKECKLTLCVCACARVCVNKGNDGEQWRWLFILVHQSNSFVQSAHKS